jgi:hypothetical protein
MWLLPPELTERVFCLLLVDDDGDEPDELGLATGTLAAASLLPLPLVCKGFAAAFRSDVLWEHLLQRCYFLPATATTTAAREDRSSDGCARQAVARAASSSSLTWGEWASRGGSEKGAATQVAHGGQTALLRSSVSSFVTLLADGRLGIVDVERPGKGEYSAASVVVAVPTGRVIQIAQTASLAVLLDEHGSVYESPLRTWSREWCTETQADPCTVLERVSLPDVFVTAVACGDTHTLSLSSHGVVFGWGDNSAGQLGDADVAPWSQPRVVTLPSDRGAPCGLAAGHRFSMIRTVQGAVLSCGANTRGQLGRLVSDSGDAAASHATFLPIGFENVRVNDAGVCCDTAISALDCGYDFCICVDERNQLVFSWGNGRDGQLGQGGNKKDMPLPKLVESMSGHGVVGVSCGRNFAAVRTAAGGVWTWGDNRRGQLGRSHKSVVGRQVKSLAAVYVSWIYCHDEDCYAICSDRSTTYTSVESPKVGSMHHRSPGGGRRGHRRHSPGGSSSSPSPKQCAMQLAVDSSPISQPDNHLAHAHNLGTSGNRAWSDKSWGTAWAHLSVPAQTSTAFFEVHIIDVQGAKRGGAKSRAGTVRVGWRCQNAHHELGGCRRSMGYGGTAKKVFRGKYEEYGAPFGVPGDAIGCLLSRAGDGGGVLFMVNGQVQGVAYNLRDCGLLSEPLFPAVACNKAEVEVRFSDFKYPFPFESTCTLPPPLSLEPSISSCTTTTATVEMHPHVHGFGAGRDDDRTQTRPQAQRDEMSTTPSCSASDVATPTVAQESPQPSLVWSSQETAGACQLQQTRVGVQKRQSQAKETDGGLPNSTRGPTCTDRGGLNDQVSRSTDEQQSYGDWVADTMSDSVRIHPEPSGDFAYHTIGRRKRGSGKQSHERRGHERKGNRRQTGAGAALPCEQTTEKLSQMVRAFALASESENGANVGGGEINEEMIGSMRGDPAPAPEAMRMRMPMGMSKAERQFVHEEARRLGLSSVSKGQGKSRHCVLLRQHVVLEADRCAQRQETALASFSTQGVLEPELEPEPEPEPELE